MSKGLKKKKTNVGVVVGVGGVGGWFRFGCWRWFCSLRSVRFCVCVCVCLFLFLFLFFFCFINISHYFFFS